MKIKTRSKYDYEGIEPKYFCIFLLNVFDFCLGSQFCRSIDEALQEKKGRKKRKMKSKCVYNTIEPK